MKIEKSEKSTEVRWFFKGPLPDEVYSWFIHTSYLGKELSEEDGEERYDIYLMTSGAVDLGLKLRGGKLELKVKRNSHQVDLESGTQDITGQIEDWEKWKWTYANVKKNDSDKELDRRIIDNFLDMGRDQTVYKVWKKRWQRKFEESAVSELEPVEMSNKSMNYGVLVEATKLKLKEHDWWTIAVEVFGEKEIPEDFLKQSLKWILRDYPGPMLLQDKSYSYPVWLSNFT